MSSNISKQMTRQEPMRVQPEKKPKGSYEQQIIECEELFDFKSPEQPRPSNLNSFIGKKMPANP